MEDQSKSVQSWSVRELAQMAPAIALGVTVLCFSVGLLIVNLRLAQYGIFSAGFVRTEYVLAGTLYFFLVALTWVAFGLAVREFTDGLAKWRELKHGRALLTFFFAVIGLIAPQVLALGTLSAYELAVHKWQFWFTMMVLIMAARYAHDFSDHLNEVWQRISKPSTAERRSTERRTKDWHSRLQALLISVVLSITIVVGYATVSYPLLSPAFGGGRRDQVVLIPTNEGLRACKAIGLPLHMKETAIGPLDILTESEHELIVLPKENADGPFKPRAIRLNRDLFEAVITVQPAKK